MDKTLYTPESLRQAKWLKEQRLAKGLTMRQLAEIIQEPHTYIAKIEHGVRRVDAVELVWYCNFLGVDPKSAIDAINGGYKNIQFTGMGKVAKTSEPETTISAVEANLSMDSPDTHDTP